MSKRGVHPMLAAVRALGWRPGNVAQSWISKLPRTATLEDVIRELGPDDARAFAACVKLVRPPPWDLLRAFPPYALEDRAPDGGPADGPHPADPWRAPRFSLR